jgi:hypothetical protein
MKLLIQPEDGIAPLLAAITQARKSVDIVIFSAIGPKSMRR